VQLEFDIEVIIGSASPSFGFGRTEFPRADSWLIPQLHEASDVSPLFQNKTLYLL
jgi:hypothetical protein